MYDEKRPDYFASARPEVRPLLPATCRRALDVGCGDGRVLGWMKQEGRCHEAWGIELVEEAAERASQVLDRVVCADIEESWPALGTEPFDLVLCLDVLEHLRDPWRAVRRLSDVLGPGGTLIVSVPNLRYWSVVRNLVMHGRFSYEEFGIMDRTHLRFFTNHSAKELLTQAGLQAAELLLHPSQISGWRALLSMASLRKDAGHVRLAVACDGAKRVNAVGR